MQTDATTVFVGLSGGVDSSVAALRLKNEGYKVVGVFIKTWQPDFIECNWEKERLDAMRVAAHLDIPFTTFDAVEAYKQKVADYMIEAYKEGLTPNPDIMCNQHVKFGVFMDFALKSGADYAATGHYAQVQGSDGKFQLMRGTDPSKDQSYFLWTLTQTQLSHTLFPVGNSMKSTVRQEAQHAGLPTFSKEDSQGICFLGHVDIKDFLSHYVKSEPGQVLDGGGNVIGSHDGALFYTIGQRHGFSIHVQHRTSVPHYVVSKDVKKNVLVVGTEAPYEHNTTLTLSHINKITFWSEKGMVAQNRYRQAPFAVSIGDEQEGRVILNVLKDIETPVKGQSTVLYRENECLGGGIIS